MLSWEYMRDEIYDFNIFLKQASVGAEQTSSGKLFQTVGASKANLCFWGVFLFMYRWIELSNLQEPFIWMVGCCTISSTTSRQKRPKVTGMTIVKKLVI